MYVVAVDAGATSTRSILVDQDGNVVSQGRGGPANPTAITWEKALENIYKAISQVLEGFSGKVELYVVSVPYTGWGRYRRRYIEYLSNKLGTDKIIVLEDYKAALLSCNPLGEGIVYIMGTGSSCYGSYQGREVLLGAWGYLLGDVCSGYSVGRKGIIEALKYFEGRGGSRILYEYMVNQWATGSIYDIIDSIYNSSSPKKLIASYAPYVVKAIEKGDQTAANVIEEEVRECLEIIGAAIKKIRYSNNKICFTGGFYSNAKHILNPLIKRIAEEVIGYEIEIMNSICPIECGLALYGFTRILKNQASSNKVRVFLENCRQRIKSKDKVAG